MTPDLLKIVVSLLTVVSLAEISKRVNPVLGGVLLGLPLGAGLSVYFIGAEQGLDFLLEGIPWAVAGLSSSLLFCLVYLGTGLLMPQKRLTSICICSIAAMAAFFLSGTVIRSIRMELPVALLIFAVVAVGYNKLLQRIPAVYAAEKPKPLRWQGLLLRGLITGVIIVGITTMAPLIGSRWAGIMTSFPSTLYALLVLIHYDGGNRLYPSVIKSFGYSVTTLVVFYLGCLWLMPAYGLNIGFVIVYFISAAYLLVVHRIFTRKSN